MCKPYYLKTAAIACILFFFNHYASAQHSSQASICTTSPYPVTVSQTDGSRLTVVGKGNIRHSWTETLDGYTVMKQNGNYQYARKVNGKLVASGLLARNPGERKSKDNALLQGTPKSLRTDLKPKELAPFAMPGARVAATSQAAFPSTGTMKALLILIKFPNLGNKYAASSFNNLMNQANYRGTGSFKDFYATSSGGKLVISTDVFGWYTAKNNYASYGNQNGSVQATQLVREAVDAAQKAGVDFSKYDNNKDGVVDGIMVAHAGPGAEEGSQLEYVWSHRWELSAGGNQVTYDGVLVDSYIINPEIRLATNDMVGRGIFCHEFGHNLGLPDLYDTDGSSEGTGDWSLMAGAGWLGNEHTPGNLCAWSKAQLGWITPTVLTASGSYSLGAASSSKECYRINTGVNNEYFLLENRQKTGLDVSLPGSGLAIWHVNAEQTSMYPLSNMVNADENRKGVDLEEADGLRHLDLGTNRGDAGDLFPGSKNNRTFNNTSNPGAKTYASSNSNVSLTQITVGTGGKISFTYGTVKPAISSITPSSGSVSTQVTINGANLLGTSTVVFNNTSASSFTIVNQNTIVATVPAGATSGKIKLNTSSGVLSSPTDFVVKTSSANPPTAIRINCGGSALTADGIAYQADQYYSSGSQAHNFAAREIANTTRDALYKDYRSAAVDKGSFSYNIPVSNGNYQIRLNFAEIFGNAAGQRIFSVNLEGGATELNNFDVFAAAGGANKMITKVYNVTVNDGTLNVAFTSSVGKATISAIQVEPVSGARTGVDEVIAENNSSRLNVYPVPSAGVVMVEFTPDAGGPAVVEVFDAKGTLATRRDVPAGQAGKVMVDGSRLPAGVYVVKVQSAGKAVYKKMVIAR